MTLIDQFIRAAKQVPDKLAIIDRATGHRVTYKAALLRSLILARKFDAFQPGFIGIMIPTSAGAILSVLAAIMSGRIPVMINYSTGAAQNCQIAQRRLAFRTVITSRALLERLKVPVVDGMVFIEDLAASVSFFDKLTGAIRSAQSASRISQFINAGAPDTNAVILFTSGSERHPKAVPLTHANLIANLEGICKVLPYGPDDIILANLPLFHVFGLNTNLWLPLVTGMTIVTTPNPLEFRAICSAIREERITMVVGTPTFLQGYLQRSEKGDFASVKLMITGADKCPAALRDGYWERHRIALLEGYGATETSPVISVNAPDRNRPGSVGLPLPNVEVAIRHWDTDAPCGVDEVGKVFVKGPSVMGGFLDDFESTANRLRHGWYDTGDMGYLDREGYLWHAGRLARFIKVGGEMVSLVHVESVLQRAVPAGVDSAVVEVADALRGSKIVAVVTEGVDHRSVMAQMSGELPRIAMPRQFIVVPVLPKMPSGKLDYRGLVETVRELVQKTDAH